MLSRITKEQLELQLLIKSKVNDEVTDFEAVDFSKTQKSKYLENETFFFKQKKFSRHTLKGDKVAKYIFLAEVTFNEHKL